MNKLNAEQILAIIEENIQVEDWGYGDFDNEGFMETLGKIEEVDQYGGEGEGDTYYRVFYFPAHDVYIKVQGHYSSYNGVDFYFGYGDEVRPEKVEVIQYKKVN